MLLTDYLFLKTDNLSTDWDILFDFAIPSEITALVERVSPDTYTAYKRLSNQNKNLFNTFCDCGEAQGKWVWFYTEVNCATNRKCILNMFFSPRGVLWVNGKPVLVQAFDWQKSYYITVDLKKGKNIFLMTTYSPRSRIPFPYSCWTIFLRWAGIFTVCPEWEMPFTWIRSWRYIGRRLWIGKVRDFHL